MAPDPGALHAVAAAQFGDRSSLAVQFAGYLAGPGVERGLLGPREVPRLWERHLLNCSVVAELVERGARVVDVGSGAGLPGVVLALARPDLHVDLVEPMHRRVVFLSEVIELLGLDATVVHGRAEDRAVRDSIGGADVVTSRAVAPLGRLASWCVPLVRPGGRVLAMKGSSVAGELARDRGAIARAGLTDVRVVECGVGVVDPAVRVVEGFRRTGRAGRRAGP